MKKNILLLAILAILISGCSKTVAQKNNIGIIEQKEEVKIIEEPKKEVDEVIAQKGLHWHAKLAIYIDGKKQDIPGDIGLGAVHQPVHTHEADGTIHLEFGGIVKKSDTALSVFFSHWGKTFNSECVFDYCSGYDKKVKMLVNGQENSEFEKYLMHDDDEIEIRYE